MKSIVEQKLLAALYASFDHPIISEITPLLTIPEHKEHGDYACNIALQIAKPLQKSPRDIAHIIVENIDTEIFEKIEIAGPGFINFFLSQKSILHAFEAFDPTTPLIPKVKEKVCFDFSHPNIAKPLHVGHIRSTVIGDSLVRLFRFGGHHVLADNFLGDWGTGFGKLIVAIEKWGDTEKINTFPMEEMVLLYQRFALEAKEDPTLNDEAREIFRKIEQDKDVELLKKWEEIMQITRDELEKFYSSIDVHFDVIRGEQFYEQFLANTLQQVEKIGEEEEGALVVHFYDGDKIDEEGNKVKKMPSILYRRSDGATLYATRDIARINFYQQEEYDQLIYVVGNEQSLHFKQIFETSKLLGNTIKAEHIGYGLVLGKDGKKFSTRRGTGISLNELFEEAEKKVAQTISDRAQDLSEEEKQILIKNIANGAIKFNDLSQNRNTDIVFDWEKMLSFEGFSGPFLQYSHARASSILRKAESINTQDINKISPSETERDILNKMISFSQVIDLSIKTRCPHHLAEYLFELSKIFNSFYQNHQILKEEDGNIRKFRLLIVKKFTQTVKQGLFLLGIHAPEKM